MEKDVAKMAETYKSVLGRLGATDKEISYFTTGYFAGYLFALNAIQAFLRGDTRGEVQQR